MNNLEFLPVFYDEDPNFEINIILKNQKNLSLRYILDSGCEFDLVINKNILEDFGFNIDNEQLMVPFYFTDIFLNFRYINPRKKKIDITLWDMKIYISNNVSTTNDFDALIGIGILKTLYTEHKLIPGIKPLGSIREIPFSSLHNKDLFVTTNKNKKFNCIIDSGSYGQNSVWIGNIAYETLLKEKSIIIKSDKKDIVGGCVNYNVRYGTIKKIRINYKNIKLNFRNLKTIIVQQDYVDKYDIMFTYSFIHKLSERHSIVPVPI